MIRRLYSLLSFVGLVSLLAAGGMAGYLAWTGALTRERVHAIVGILRGESDLAASQSASQPASSQPASQPASKSARSADELREQRRAEQQRRAVLERAERDVAAQRELLRQAMQELLVREERFETSRKTWKHEQERLRDVARDEGFERELKYVAKLPARQAKDHLVKTWNKQRADAVRLMNALPASAGQRILEQLKTPEELTILHELLEQVRMSGAEAPSATPEPGTVAAGQSP